MGYSGIVATNAGLALLGGGSIAAGGLGIAGGTAILTAALEFGTVLIIEYTASSIYSEYNYKNFSEQSKNMVTLPVPRNTSGSNSYEEAMDVLEDISSDLPLSSNQNQIIIKKALQTLDSMLAEELDESDKSKNETLYALLYFQFNNYHKAKTHAKRAINSARNIDKRRTAPAFIYAVSSLYDKQIDFDELHTNYFRYSILAEPDNPIIPLLFAVYLDRIIYRFNDQALDADSLRKVALVAMDDSISKTMPVNLVLVLSRYFIRLKIEQQKISSLTTTDNITLKNSPNTLNTVKFSLQQYEKLLVDADNIFRKLLFSSLELDEDSHSKAEIFYDNFNKYKNDKERLRSLIKELEIYQESLKKEKHTDVLPENVNTDEQQNDYNRVISLFFAACFGFLFLLFLWRVASKK